MHPSVCGAFRDTVPKHPIEIHSAYSLQLVCISLTPFLTCLILIPFNSIHKYLVNHLQPTEIINIWGLCSHIAHTQREINVYTLLKTTPNRVSFSVYPWTFILVCVHFQASSQLPPASSCGPSPAPPTSLVKYLTKINKPHQKISGIKGYRGVSTMEVISLSPCINCLLWTFVYCVYETIVSFCFWIAPKGCHRFC